MPAWLWLLIAVGLGAVELMVLTFDLALLATAALAATIAAGLGLGTGIQLVVFGVSAAVLLGVVRPFARRFLVLPPVMQSGTAALIGKQGRVLTEVTSDSGLVKIGGEEWTARPYDPTLAIPPGTTVDVMEIEGATALVYPREEPWALK